MPRYFYNIHDGAYRADDTGTDLNDIYEAQAEAIKLCGALVAEIGARFWDHGEWKLEVCGPSAKLLFTLTLKVAEEDLSA